MHLQAEAKKIDRLKRKFPNMEIRQISQNEWELVGVRNSDWAEIARSLDEKPKTNNIPEIKKETPVMEKVVEKAVQIADNNVDKPIQVVTSALSEGLSGFANILMAQTETRLRMLESQIQGLAASQDASKKAAQTSFETLRDSIKADFEKFKGSVYEDINKEHDQTTEFMGAIEKKLLNFAKSIDDANESINSQKQKIADKFSKIAVLMKE